MTFDFDELWRSCWEAWCASADGLDSADARAAEKMQAAVCGYFVPRTKFSARAGRLRETQTAFRRATAKFEGAQAEDKAVIQRLQSAADQLADAVATLQGELFTTRHERDSLRQELEAMRALLAAIEKART